MRKGIKKLALTLALGVLCASNLTAKENLDDELTYANFRDIRDLNPHLYGGEIFAQNLVFESLIKINDDKSFSPWLASSWTISEDGKTYTFKLREDVSFTDGVKFNAKVAKQNFDAILDNSTRHGWLESVRLMKALQDKGIEPVIVSGEYELTIKLADAYYPFLIELGVTRPYRFISPNSFVNGTTKNGVSSFVGTGAYYLKSNKINEYSIFEVNKNYWGEKPKINKLIVKVIPDNQTRLFALQSGEIDLIYGSSMIDALSYNTFSKVPGFVGSLSEPISTKMMLLNTTDEVLNDVNVRRAIQYATNKEKISLGIFEGLEAPADTLLATNVPYANIGLKPYSFSFEKAEELLESSGWKKQAGSKYRYKDAKELKITLHYDSNKVTHKNIAEFLQSEYKKVGINLELFGEEAQAHNDRMKLGDFDFIFTSTWGVPYDPQSLLGSMRKKVHGDYMAQLGLENKKELDQNILDAIKSVDEEKRAMHYKYVLETLHKQAVYLPLTYERNRAIYNEKVKNVKFNISKYEVPLEQMSKEK